MYRAGKGGDETVTRRDGFLAEAVQLEPRISVEILFLGAATVYAFFVPLGGSINAVDTLVVVYSLSLGSYGVLAFIITAART